MFMDLIDLPIESDKLQWTVRHVLRDFPPQTHLLLRLTLTGTMFPLRDEMPVVTVDGARARYVELADDCLSVRAYFAHKLPQGGRIEFGYGPLVMLRFPKPFDEAAVAWLDPARIPADVRFYDAFFGQAGEPAPPAQG